MRSSQNVAFLLLALFVCSPINAWAVAAANDDGQVLKSLSPMVDKTKAGSGVTATEAPKLFQIHAGISEGYILGPGDIIAITDTSDDKPVVQTVPILPDGSAVTTYTGVIQAAGLSLQEINQYINEKARKWFVNPQLIVSLAKQRPVQVYLLGEVVHPGLYTVGGEAGMLTPTGGSEHEEGAESGDGGAGALNVAGSTNFTLSGALQMAGGLKETADVRHLRVSRLAPKQTFQLDLWKLMVDGDVSEDIHLQPGDVVYVPKGGAQFDASDLGKLANGSPKIRVFGAVKSPGLVTMNPDDDIMSVIAKCGGFSDTAVTKYFILARTNHDGTISYEKVNFDKGIKDSHAPVRAKVRAGDLIIVKSSITKTIGVGAAKYLPYALMYGGMTMIRGF
jgi:polysaccharide export outer membrane protein